MTDAMLLGHWYLVQPGLSRAPLEELVTLCLWVWPIEVIALCLPPGMLGVLFGIVDDGYGGLLGWMWVVSALTTIVLVYVTKLALAGAVLLGGHGRDRSAVPRDPHRVRHRRRRPRAPHPLTPLRLLHLVP